MSATARKSGESVDQWYQRVDEETKEIDERVSLAANLLTNVVIELMIKGLLIGGCFGAGFVGVTSLLGIVQGHGLTCHFGA